MLYIKNEHKVQNQLDFPAEQWNVVRQGMRQVVSVHTSSSALINQINVAVAGKTGTAQQSEARPNHALFVSFAPYENPEVTVTSVIHLDILPVMQSSFQVSYMHICMILMFLRIQLLPVTMHFLIKFLIEYNNLDIRYTR